MWVWFATISLQCGVLYWKGYSTSSFKSSERSQFSNPFWTYCEPLYWPINRVCKSFPSSFSSVLKQTCCHFQQSTFWHFWDSSFMRYALLPPTEMSMYGGLGSSQCAVPTCSSSRVLWGFRLAVLAALFLRYAFLR